MLSAESATGRYPVEAVAMLAEIAAAIEPHRPGHHVRDILLESPPQGEAQLADLIARSVETTLQHTSASAVFVPTQSGYTARRIARFRPPVWVVAVSSYEATCQNLQFTFGVYPVLEPDHPENWKEYARRWLRDYEIKANLVILTEGPSSKHPEANNRMEIIDLAR